jgi:MoxR-like ATPase
MVGASAPPPEISQGWPGAPALATVDDMAASLAAAGYLADRALATACYLSLRLERPLLLEGEAGVGKTELAKTLAVCLGAPLIRLQCYEGIDVSQAVYEWNHPQQLLAIRQQEVSGDSGLDVFSPRFLIRRPLLLALDPPDQGRAVLLIDELDRSDDEFEAFLLEMLSDWQVTIPELGTLRARRPPAVICTSNRTRELHDALKRRCLFHWIDYPTAEAELAIVRLRAPWVEPALARQVVTFVQSLRRLDLYKVPGVAETLDWAAALVALERDNLSVETVEATLGSLLKYQEDLATMSDLRLAELVHDARPDR